jgi:hypothetical protein
MFVNVLKTGKQIPKICDKTLTSDGLFSVFYPVSYTSLCNSMYYISNAGVAFKKRNN